MGKATILDVARLAGVSASTVSRYLNRSAHLSEEAGQLVAQAVRKLDYRPSATARTMRTRRSHCLGVLVPDIANPFFVEIAGAIERTAAFHGYTVMLCNTDEDSAREEKIVRALIDRNVDGLIMIASENTTPATLVQASRIPMVAIDRVLSGARVASIVTDHVQGGYLAAKYLLDLGHRKIALLNGPLSITNYDDRYQGFRQALDEYGVAWDQSLHLRAVSGVEAGAEALLGALDRGASFTAVFAANDLLAIGALLAVRRRGLRVPEDVAILGYDNIKFSEFTFPRLSTVDQPKSEMGRISTETLIRHLDAGESLPEDVVRLAPRLVPRETCAAVDREGGGSGK